jgi:predicted nucleic acid-binding protein
MGIVVDTSVWVDVERGRITHTAIADLVGGEPIYLAPPVLAELEYGVNRARTPEQRAKRQAALARIRRKPCLIIDRDTGEIFGRLAAELDRQGTPATHRVQDLWIAAVAIQNACRVLTGNPQDFAGLPGLDVVAAPLQG